MAAGASFFTDSKLSDIQTDIIVDNQKLAFFINLIIIHQAAQALAAKIHVGLRLSQNYFLPLYDSFSDQGSILPAVYRYIIFAGKRIYDIEAGIMPRAFVL